MLPCQQPREGGPSNTIGERLVIEAFLLVPGSLSFRHARISCPASGLLGTATFFEFGYLLYYFVFINPYGLTTL